MNIKKILCFTLAFIMAVPFFASAKTLEFTLGENTMYERSETLTSHTLETAPYAQNQRTMVPVRIVSERFGADVSWNGEANQITITGSGKTIILTLGSTEAVVNGEAVKLDAAPEAINGRTMVPLRFISENLGMDVDYVGLTNQIIITDEEAIFTINGIDVNIDDYYSYLFYVGIDPNADIINTIYDATYTIAHVYGISDYLNKNGYVSDGTLTEECRNDILEYEDEIHEAVLTAPIAKLIENNMLAVEIEDSFASSKTVFATLAEDYEENYVTAKHILIGFDSHTDAEAEKLAKDILKQLKNGADFDELMEKYCEDPGAEANPDGYTFTTGEMVEPFETASFALKEGEISTLVKSDFGYHIIKRCPLKSIDSCTLEEFKQIYTNLSLKDSKLNMNKSIYEIAAMFS